MGRRWVLLALAVSMLFFPLLVAAHKNPIVKYTYVGHIWEESYYTIPQQPVVDERIVFKTGIRHPNETIEGNVTALISVYEDDTTWQWYGGKSYKRPDWLLFKEAWMSPDSPERDSQYAFTEDVVIGQPGSYHVFIDWYENRQYIGQSMHTLDVETRTIGPMYLAFNAILIVAVLAGVWRGIL